MQTDPNAGTEREKPALDFGRIRNGWIAAALVVFNTLALLFVLNAALWVAYLVKDGLRGEREFVIPLRRQNPGLDLKRVYRGYTDARIDSLLTEEYTRRQVYEAFTQHRDQARTGRFINVRPEGFREIGAPGVWPPDPKATNIFVFGDSTTFGSGLADHEGIPAHLQDALTRWLGPGVRVYNFGRSFYYSTQERSLFETYLVRGIVPDAAIFIDGFNDFLRPDPAFTDRLSSFMAGDVPAVRSNPFERIPLVRFTLALRNHLVGTEAGFTPAVAAFDTVPDEQWDRMVIDRYRANQRMIRALAREFGVKVVFVWQPVPTYRYDRSQQLFGFEPNVERVGRGYPRFAKEVAATGPDPDLLWLADMQQDIHEPLYVDHVHYTAGFARTIADEIVTGIRERGLLAGLAPAGRSIAAGPATGNR